VPGDVGGSLRMNAGAMGGEMFDHVVRVTFLDEDGVIRTREREEIETGYRDVPELRRNFALQAVFKGKSDQPRAIRQRIEDTREKRRSSQPVSASAGCMFRNDTSIPAGKLIDELGLKGTTIGGAMISDIHGNFIVNQGGATAKDILALMDLIRRTALEERGIDLLSEVKVIGEDECPF
jgi:UDP-N-acetylenolpyruvoylglucosamine reductase